TPSRSGSGATRSGARWTGPKKRRLPTSESEENDPVTEFLRLPDGTRLAWDAAGEGPMVLFVHGIGYTGRKWEPQIEPVARAGYRAVRFDLRGFGESETPEGTYTMNDFLGDLVRVVEEL